MDYDDGSTFGYDQVGPSMLTDDYDAAYTPSAINAKLAGQPPTCSNQERHRTMLPPPRYGTERPIASYEEYNMKPRRTLDSQSIGRRPVTESFSMPGLSDGASLQMPGGLDINSILLLFIFVLIIIMVINSINLRHLAKQVKMLTRAAAVGGASLIVTK